MRRRHQWWLLAVIAVASAVTAVSLTGATAASAADETQAIPTVDSNVTVERTDSNGETNQFTVTIRFENYTGTDPYYVTGLHPEDVDRVDGFDRSERQFDAELYWWDGETETPVIEYTLESRDNWDRNGAVPFPNLETEYVDGKAHYWDGERSYYIGNRAYSVAGPGGHVHDRVFFGEATVHRHSIGGKTVPFVVPASVDPEVDPETAASAMAHTHRALNVTDDVYLDVVWYTDEMVTEGLASGSSVYLKPFASSLTARHEYVHTQQEYATSDLGWFSEGSADYLASLAAVLGGDRTFEEFYSDANTPMDSEANLLDYDDDQVHYTKGERVVAAIDARIRNETDGEASVVDLVRALNRNSRNASEQPLDQLFLELDGLTGAQTADQFRPYLTEPAVPLLPSPGEFRELVASSQPNAALTTTQATTTSGAAPADSSGGDGDQQWLSNPAVVGALVVAVLAFFLVSVFRQ